MDRLAPRAFDVVLTTVLLGFFRDRLRPVRLTVVYCDRWQATTKGGRDGGNGW